MLFTGEDYFRIHLLIRRSLMRFSYLRSPLTLFTIQKQIGSKLSVTVTRAKVHDSPTIEHLQMLFDTFLSVSQNFKLLFVSLSFLLIDLNLRFQDV